MTAFKYTFLSLLVLSVAPLLSLKLYIKASGDFEARWLFIQFLSLQLIIWIGFALSLFWGVVILIKRSRYSEHNEKLEH